MNLAGDQPTRGKALCTQGQGLLLFLQAQLPLQACGYLPSHQAKPLASGTQTAYLNNFSSVRTPYRWASWHSQGAQAQRGEITRPMTHGTGVMCTQVCPASKPVHSDYPEPS